VNPVLTEPDAALVSGFGDAAATQAEDTAASTSSTEPRASSYSAPRSDASTGDGADAGGSRSILCGIQPGSADADAGVVSRALARLEVTALGSRILTYVSSTTADDFSELRGAKDLNFIVTLPFALFKDMSDADVALWIERVWSVGERVRFVIVGQHIESDLAELSPDEHVRMVSRLSSTLTMAVTHPQRPYDAMVGVGLARAASVPTELIAASQVMAFSYSAVGTSGAVDQPEDAFQRVLERAESVAEFRRPVIFQDLAYPSVEGEEPQRQFFAALRKWLTQANLPDIRALVISSLDAPDPRDCELWSDDWQVADPAVRCSVGVRNDAEPKGALNEVVGLLAHFAQL
jgi:hypothetical protein